MSKVTKSRVPLFLVWLFDTFKTFGAFFIRRKPLTGEHDFKEPFFIIGCGRSGNTLLRSILVAGGEVAIPPESYVWPRIIRRFRAYSFLPWDILSSMMVSEFEAFKEFYTWEINLFKAHHRVRHLPREKQTLSNILHQVYLRYCLEKGMEVNRWGDKTPINTIYADKLLKVFPKAQFVFIERDPRDVVCSYVKAGLYDNYTEPAEFWQACRSIYQQLKRSLPPEQIQKITYEDLVSNPEHEIEIICKFLGLAYRKDMLEFWKKNQDLGDVKYGEHHKNVKSPISTSSIGKWKSVLTDQDLATIEEIIDTKEFVGGQT